MTDYTSTSATGVPGGTDPTGISPYPTRAASPKKSRVLLPVAAAVLLVLGLAFAVTGIIMKSSADSSFQAAEERLPVATGERDAAQEQFDEATDDAAVAAASLAAATAEGQRVAAIAATAATLGDQLVALDQRTLAAGRELAAALVSGSNARAQAAVTEFNAAVNAANDVLVAYDQAIATLSATSNTGGVTNS